jgi:SNW domain-containing protein 1
MGKPNKKASATSSAIVAVDVGADGEVKYDAIVKQGTNRDKLAVYTSLKDMKAKEGDSDALRLPTDEEEAKAAEKTRLALEGIIGAKVAANKPFALPAAPNAGDPKFISYTPNPNAPGVAKGGKQRIIRMVEEQVDPMEPAKHAHKKVPRGPPEDPVPILHSPQRKTTVADQQAWKVPPCVSNWKNIGGFTIPLDKRLAADGRGLQEQTINNNFATLAESLYIAERKAREELEARAKITQKLKAKEKDQKEKELRDIAAAARMARAGVVGSASDRVDGNNGSFADDRPPRDLTEGRRDNRPAWMVEAERKNGGGGGGDEDARMGRDAEEDGEAEGEEQRQRDQRGAESSEEAVAMQQRDRLRRERRKERERELRMDNMRGEFKRSKHEQERERDISEKIALGLTAGAQKLTGDQRFDSRLFNQSEGMSSGFGKDDDYNVYSKPLFDRGEAASIYRPKRDDAGAYGDGDAQYKELTNTSKFKPDKGFRGADSSDANSGRDGPVQFQREQRE